MNDQGPLPPAGDPWGLEDEGPPRPGRRWVLLVAGTLPWLVVALLVLRPGAPQAHDGHESATPLSGPSATPPESHPATPGAGPSVPGGGPGAGSPSPSAPPTDAGGELDATLVTSRGRLSPDAGDAVTVAVLIARSWFAGAGPVLPPVTDELAPTQTGYVEHLWVEAVDRPWRDHAVVALGAVVLVPAGADDQQTLRPVARRLAVPVALDRAGARPAGVPWLLPAPQLTFDPLVFTPVDDEQLALSAADALVDAGYDLRDLLALERSDGWPWRAVIEAAAPGSDQVTRHTVWLRQHLAAFVVAGWLPPLPQPDASHGHDASEASAEDRATPPAAPATQPATEPDPEDGEAVDQEQTP